MLITLLIHVLEMIKSPLVGKSFCNADLFVIVALITLLIAVDEKTVTNVTNSMLVTQNAPSKKECVVKVWQ